MTRSKIVYNKEKSGKILSRGGPRDIQLRQRIIQESLMRDEETPYIVPSDRLTPSVGGVDMSQYLPLSKVKEKIEEAVESTRETVKKKYESGIQSLSIELNEARREVNKLKEEILYKNKEISKLVERISATPDVSEFAQKQINNRDSKIVSLETDIKSKAERHERQSRDISDLTIKLENASRLLQERDAELKQLHETMLKRDEYLHEKDIEIHNKNMELIEIKSRTDARSDISSELSTKLDKLYEKISDGSIRHLVGSKMDRPELEDRIFIDPLEIDDGKDLDPHIEIEEEKTQDRDVSEDVDKLRSLLKLTKRR